MGNDPEDAYTHLLVEEDLVNGNDMIGRKGKLRLLIWTEEEANVFIGLTEEMVTKLRMQVNLDLQHLKNLARMRQEQA
ncbi:hypothetical protein OIU78_014447 [Salix suchowensis]|nr:hypothetical protein OIU78_014447 [Salix suchowensis]